MFEKEIKKYQALNKLAESNGIVILGSEDDMSIPFGELKQAFEIESKIYNRSVADLSVVYATDIYDKCIAELYPETVLIHIGMADIELFKKNPALFDKAYRNLVEHIKNCNPKTRIAVVSLRNFENDEVLANINKHLSYIADSEHCEYGDISSRRVWNPKNTKEAYSFAYSVSFVNPFVNHKPIYDLIKILFCYEV